MNIIREIRLEDEAKNSKTLLILGPRRVGKTTLVQDYLKNKEKVIAFDGSLLETQEIFSINSLEKISPHIDGAKYLFIDEAQEIQNIGKTLKIINDHRPDLILIASGSSSFELMGQVGEPLVGRKITRFLYPFSTKEIIGNNFTEFAEKYRNWLIYGMYPNSITAESTEQKQRFLNELVNSLLLKDILTFQEVKGSKILFDLLKLLAYQIGNEVSIEELGNTLGIGKNTVTRYIDLLEKAYIVFELGGYSRNLRSEINKKSKYFFYDTGVRNAIINNYNDIDLRPDRGALWENFAIVERMKRREYSIIMANQYFWRTWKGSEIDLVEEREGQLFGYEMKFNDKKETQAPKEWTETYGKEANFQTITPDNFLEFLS